MPVLVTLLRSAPVAFIYFSVDRRMILPMIGFPPTHSMVLALGRGGLVSP